MKTSTQGSTKMKRVGYWIATGLTAFAFLVGGAADLAATPDMLASMAHLGYPPYLATILGVWKILGAVAILAPGFPRLKEWAYAGIFFDLTGAAVSHAAAGDETSKVLTPLVLLLVVAASWALRPEDRTLKASVTSAPKTVTPGPATAEASLAT